MNIWPAGCWRLLRTLGRGNNWGVASVELGWVLNGGAVGERQYQDFDQRLGCLFVDFRLVPIVAGVNQRRGSYSAGIDQLLDQVIWAHLGWPAGAD